LQHFMPDTDLDGFWARNDESGDALQEALRQSNQSCCIRST
jgi:hypothetical protein